MKLKKKKELYQLQHIDKGTKCYKCHDYKKYFTF